MAKLTWLGEDTNDVPGPSFTKAFDMKFVKGTPVEVSDQDIIARASKNQFFKVQAGEAAIQTDEPDDLKGMTIAELRNLADASGITHEGMSKAELRDAILAHDEKVND